jgi:hypothetical protein
MSLGLKLKLVKLWLRYVKDRSGGKQAQQLIQMQKCERVHNFMGSDDMESD